MLFLSTGYDLGMIRSLHKDFNAFSTCSLYEEDNITCAPRFLRGQGGVSLLWRKSLNSKLHKFFNDKFVVYQHLAQPVMFLLIYNQGLAALMISRTV